jgi:hypothetical protein
LNAAGPKDGAYAGAVRRVVVSSTHPQWAMAVTRGGPRIGNAEDILLRHTAHGWQAVDWGSSLGEGHLGVPNAVLHALLGAANARGCRHGC